MSAQEGVKGLRDSKIVPEGTREVLKTIAGKLDEAEKAYVDVFKTLVRAFGDDPDEKPSLRVDDTTEDPEAA